MDLVNSLNDRLLFAVPKKGRLNQACLDLLSGSDIQFHRHDRLDIALGKNLPLALVFLPAGDIPAFIEDGRVDLGITGRDQVAEHEAEVSPTETTGVREIMDLGFGGCKLQVQVPVNGSIQTSEQLIGKNIATSFTKLAEKYFSELEARQSDVQTNGNIGNKLRTRIRYISGSVEAACAIGGADGIVDLVESGETMRIAGLKAIDTVVESTAVLISSKHPSDAKLVNIITNRIRGVIQAQKYVLCTYNVERSLLGKATEITPGRRAPTVTPLEEEGWVAVSVMEEKKNIATVSRSDAVGTLQGLGQKIRFEDDRLGCDGTILVMDELTELGALDIFVTRLENSRTAATI